MRGALLRLIVLLPCLCCCLAAPSLRGVDPRLKQYYQPADGSFSCLDGKKAMPLAWVNDDFCDCFDGSDEPGTAACPNGRFYCANVGSQPSILNASFVDDGVCDCCDGTDEPHGACANTCRDLGERVLASLRAELRAAQAGAAARERYARDAVAIKQGWQLRVRELQDATPRAEAEAKRLEGNKVRAEAEESRLAEQHRRAEERARKLLEAATPAADPVAAEPAAAAAAAVAEGEPAPATGSAGDQADGALADQDQAGQAYLDSVYHRDPEDFAAEPEQAAEQGGEQGGQEQQQDETSEELAQRVASQWIPGAVQAGHKKAVPAAVHDQEEAVPEHERAAAEAAAAAAQPHCGDSLANGDESDVDCGGSTCPTCALGRSCVGPSDCTSGLCVDGKCVDAPPPNWLNHAWDWASGLRGVAWAADTRAGRAALALALRLEARLSARAQALLPWRTGNLEVRLAAARADLEAAKAAHSAAAATVKALQDEGAALTAKLAGQYGEGDVFVPLVDKCITANVDKYKYEICPYGSATQREGSSSTSLGSWQGFSDDKGSMLFKQGATCWQGPARSITVSLRCGASETLDRVEEPSRCEYAAVLSTPAMCSAAAVEQLRTRVDAQLAALAAVPTGGAASAHEELRR